MNYQRIWLLIVFLLMLSPAILANAADNTPLLTMSKEAKAQKQLRAAKSGRRTSEKEFLEKMTLHKQWLDTKGRAGKRADFFEADFSNMPLVEWDFSGANLKNANFTNTNFYDCVFIGADLTSSNFSKAIIGDSNFLRAKLNGANFEGAMLERGELELASMEGANFKKANLKKANLNSSRLVKANLEGADLTRASLENAILSYSVLKNTDLSSAKMKYAKLDHVDLRGADLSSADARLVSFWAANMEKTILDGTDLRDSDFFEANLNGAVIDPGDPNVVFRASGMQHVKNLSKVTYRESPSYLSEIKIYLQRKHLRQQERQITYAIMHNDRVKSYSLFWSAITYVLFELPSGWGLYPGRPLLIMLVLIPAFFFPYLLALLVDKKDGIWQAWPEDRARSDLGSSAPQRLNFKWADWRAYVYALYFSVLSAFHIGWRDLNVGTWISRMQPREYTLRATGWVRTVSGIQSLISVYLLALAILTYFGRPFG